MSEEPASAKVSFLSLESDLKIKKCLVSEGPCRPSTSKGISSQSSGDYDGSDYTFCKERCSCESLPYQPERSCSIADSSTFLHKSIWKAFKKYIICRLKGKKKEGKNKNQYK